MYGAIKIYETTINGFYIVQFLSGEYTLQNNTTIDGQVISVGELVFKAQYICSMQENTNWCWKEQPLHQTIMFPTRTILHSRVDVITIRYVQHTPKNICNISQEIKSIQRHPIIMTDAGYDYILDEIERREKNDFERNVSVNSDEDYY